MGQTLHTARDRYGHTQSTCADALVKLGAETASQSAVSHWERGNTYPDSRATLEAIGVYCQEAPGTDRDSLRSDREHETRIEDEPFERMVSRLTGSPILSGRQAQLLDAAIQRILTGPPTSASDVDLFKLIAKILDV